MKKIDIFNEDSICIFTDSSFKNESKNPKIAIGTTAPSFEVFHNETCIETGFHILHNSTSQQGELYAVLLGVMASYKYRNFKHIRLFSDSQNSILGIRDRIFNWVRDTNNGKSVLGDDGRINNQSYIMDIVYTIIYNNIPIEFYHQKGHVNIKNYQNIIEARDLFKRSNNIYGFVEDSLIITISQINNWVDQYSSLMLKNNISDPKYFTEGLTPAVEIGYAPFDISNYYNLVKKEK